MRSKRMAAFLVAGIMLVALLGGCSVIKAATAPPLPPPETLNLGAQILPGGETSVGNRTVRISWTPPGASVDKIILEQSESRGGPWQEIKLVDAKRGFHDETSIFRPGRFYYFRASLLRGNEESPFGPPVELWVPQSSSQPTPTPTPRPSPTPTPATAAAADY